MNGKFIRIYKRLNIREIKQHLMIYGDLSAQCANCQALDLKLELTRCPHCQMEFQYISFRNIKNHIPKLQRLSEEKPTLVFVDYEDFQRHYGSLKAEEFLK